MILEQSTLAKPFAGYTNPTVACITADGEPRERTWIIHAKWFLRDGKVSGEIIIENKWLNAALSQFATFEKRMLKSKYGTATNKAQFVLHCPPEIHRSVRGIATRYCIPCDSKGK